MGTQRRAGTLAAVNSGVTIAILFTFMFAIGCTWILAIGRYGGPDEPAHVLRAAAVGNGQIYGTPTPSLPPGFRGVSVPATLATGDPACYRLDARRNASCAREVGAAGRTVVATSAANYPPLYYAMVGLPTRWIGRAGDARSYRLIAYAWNLAVLALVGWRLRPLGRRAVVALAAITPAAWFLLSVVNPNGLEVVLMLLSWVGVARLGDRRGERRSELLWISLPAAAAIAIRPVALVAAPTVCVVVWVAQRPLGRRRFAQLCGPPLLAAAAVQCWNIWIGLRVDDARTAVQASNLGAAGHAIAELPTTLWQAIGSLSWLELSAPWPVVVSWMAGAVAITWWGLRRAPSRERQAWAVWLALLVVTPVAFTVLAHDRVGYIWQGRYSLPTLLGIAAIGLGRRDPLHPRLFAACVTIFAISEAATFWTTLRRSVVGTDGSWWLGGANAWSPGLPPRLLLVIHLVLVLAVGAMAVLMVGSDTVLADSVDPDEH